MSIHLVLFIGAVVRGPTSNNCFVVLNVLVFALSHWLIINWYHIGVIFNAWYKAVSDRIEFVGSFLTCPAREVGERVFV